MKYACGVASLPKTTGIEYVEMVRRRLPNRLVSLHLDSRPADVCTSRNLEVFLAVPLFAVLLWPDVKNL
jgi:hypothetical protein